MGPSSILILGTDLHSINQVACLPQEKLSLLQNPIGSCFPRNWCNRHKLESLIRHLHHTAKVVWLGRTSLRHMIDPLCYLCINQEFHLDLLWWPRLLAHWHGISFWLFPGLLLARSAMEHTQRATGLLAPGLGPSSCSLLPTTSSSYSSCSSCLQTLLGQEPYHFSLTLMQ